MNEYIIVMKVGPHSNMSLNEIIESKIEEEKIHGVHFWGYSGVFCHPLKVQKFCEECYDKTKENVKLILIETKSNYNSEIGCINYFSKNSIDFESFKRPVQLQGAQYSFVAKNLREIKNFSINNYLTVGGKNDNKPLSNHLKFRVNKSFAKLNKKVQSNNYMKALEVYLVYPYAVWHLMNLIFNIDFV